MRQLQTNFTDVEQSKKLLSLGLPADSADCYWRNYGDLENRADVRFVLNGYDKIHTIKDCYEPDTEITPCWSLGRLMEIFDICTGSELDWLSPKNVLRQFGKTYINWLVFLFEVHIKETQDFEFSKLDEEK